jgi:hypothetical protein
MKLICPVCSSCASLEAWLGDVEARTFIVAVTNLPAELQKCAIAYIGLFRPEKGRGLAWNKANRLLAEFAELVAQNTINWDGAGAKNINARTWKTAVEAVVERRPAQLKNHNYLKHTAYDFAAKAESSFDERSKPEPVSSVVCRGETAPVKVSERVFTEEERIRGAKIFAQIHGRILDKTRLNIQETDDEKRKRMLDQGKDGNN